MNKKFSAVGLLLIVAVVFSGCGIRDFFSTLGFDTHDYEGEEILETHDGESETAAELAEMLKILTIHSPVLTPFNGANEAMESCRDSVLNYMLNESYAKYTGNITLLDQVKDAYPHMQVSAIIPAEDFENTVYTYFGGRQKIKNVGSTLFVYLEKVHAYITVAQPQESSVQFEIQKIEETENTYRVYFYCTLHEEVSPAYKALIIKRDDGNSYFRYLEEE